MKVKYKLPTILIVIGIMMCIIGAFLKIIKIDGMSIVLMIGMIIEFLGIVLLLLRRFK
jgi:hypothetical protein